jgi:hypothetical protein
MITLTDILAAIDFSEPSIAALTYGRALARVLITSNAPYAAIVDYATQKHIGLIVAGTHGHGAVAHALVGSVAERIVRTAPCPVLTVRNPEQEFVVPDTFAADGTA